jgi:hypothetical protein
MDALFGIFEKQNVIPFLFAVAAILVATAILGTIRWTRERILSFGGRLSRRGWSELNRPFAWVATEAQEWRRLSDYRRRDLTWDDLPQNSKDSVGLHDLSESTRQEIRLSDLPQGEKRDILRQDISA